jgi:hypothetical protein
MLVSLVEAAIPVARLKDLVAFLAEQHCT